MVTLEPICGVWKAVAYEQGGVARNAEEVLRQAHLILLPDEAGSKARGVWGEVKYLGELTPSTVVRSINALKQLVAGQQYDRSPDYYLYSGGVVLVGEAAEGGGTIDLIVDHGPHTYPPGEEPSVSRGLFRYDGTNLTLCLVDAAVKERPRAFDSTRTRYQSISTYVRESLAGSINGRR
jgi:hypothetical protein